MLDKLQSWVTVGLATLVLAIGGYAIVQDQRLDEITRQRDAAIIQRHAAERALIVLADQHAEAMARKTTATAAREAIRLAPASEDAPVAQVLLRALEAADQIGGLK